MAIDWKSPENNERLLTCVYAWLQESNVTINHHRIAAYFGNGATYDAVQGNFRKFKQRIEDVKGVLSGRVGKEVEADVKEEESTELADGV
ncbi:hypothetical protein EG328_006230 [Venturia inaequalis]|uniref:Uncharacterized protein n=1 Tax=Venturia inaequalis TaxID=5025 RepID=A0A8H3VET0_VENIN|nr:hypothetical protein EG328_006230 [Venturia inaequalis]